MAILKLVEDGELELNDKVFGSDGILAELEYSIVDERLLDITVEHLLRHSAGWDEHKGPYYDPMLNKLYIARGYNVEDIEDVEKPEGLLNHYDLIRYVTKHPLAFAPGTSVRYSNFGYCLLGRIIEEVSDVPYEEFIHRHIIQPVGMMHTKIGDSYGIPAVDGDDPEATVEIDSQLIHGLVTPNLLDSTLGWYSSVQDIARLTINLMYPSANQLLKPETLEIMFSRPHTDRPSDSPSWYGVGVHVRNDGAFWQESDRFDNDCIVYHIGLRGFIAASKKNDREILDQDFTFIALAMNNRFKKLKSAMERLVPLVKEWPLPIMPDRAIDDLADIRIRSAKDDMLIKKRLPEQHLLAYSNALRQAQYAPTWLQGYYDGDTTHFVVISSKQENPDNLHFRLEISNHAKKIRNRIHHWENVDSYQVAFVQNYISASHNGDVTHIALLNKSLDTGPEQRMSRPVRWGVKTKIQDYLSMLAKRSRKGYTVVAQSVSAPNQDATVDYILHRKRPYSNNANFASYHDLTLQQLETVAKANAVKEFALTYLDTHHDVNDYEEPRFSAVFSERKKARWILQIGVKDQNLAQETEIWQARGYTPRIIVGYYHDGGLNFATLWRM